MCWLDWTKKHLDNWWNIISGCVCFWKTLAFDSVYKVKRCPLTTVNGHHPSAEGSNGTETQRAKSLSLLELEHLPSCLWASEFLVPQPSDSKTYTNSPLILRPSHSDWIISPTFWLFSLQTVGLLGFHHQMSPLLNKSPLIQIYVPYWFFFSGDLRLTQVHFSFWVPVDLMLSTRRGIRLEWGGELHKTQQKPSISRSLTIKAKSSQWPTRL